MNNILLYIALAISLLNTAAIVFLFVKLLPEIKTGMEALEDAMHRLGDTTVAINKGLETVAQQIQVISKRIGG